MRVGSEFNATPTPSFRHTHLLLYSAALNSYTGSSTSGEMADGYQTQNGASVCLYNVYLVIEVRIVLVGLPTPALVGAILSTSVSF